MESEALTFLRAKAENLAQQVSDLRARLKKLQEEQVQIEAGIMAMTGVVIAPTGAAASRQAVVHHARMANPDADKRTIKQLVMEALSGHFANGATAVQLLDHFEVAYGRADIVRTSLSPQLSRLKDEGKIRREGRVWRVNEDDFDSLLGDEEPLDENGEANADPDVGNEGAATPSNPEFDL